MATSSLKALPEQEIESASSSITLTESVTQSIMDDIVHGRLRPGSKLGMDQLKKLYGMGASPLREALTRLLSLGFVTNESRRGFRVATVSYEDIVEITEVRKLIELRALELSIRKGGKAWEEQVVMQMARLRHAILSQRANQATLNPASDGVHEDYHRALIGGCGSPRLIGLQEIYYDLAKRYRLLVFQVKSTRDEFLSRHEVLTDIVLSRKLSKACDELDRHLDLLIAGLPDDLSHPKRIVRKS